MVRRHGVAHFLFHPAHILKQPGVADALRGLVEYGRSQGLEWWTNEQIYQWEMLRRGVRAEFDTAQTFTLHAAKPLRDATLLLLKSGTEPLALHLGQQPAVSRPWSLYGFEFEAVTVDLAGRVPVRVG